MLCWNLRICVSVIRGASQSRLEQCIWRFVLYGHLFKYGQCIFLPGRWMHFCIIFWCVFFGWGPIHHVCVEVGEWMANMVSDKVKGGSRYFLTNLFAPSFHFKNWKHKALFAWAIKDQVTSCKVAVPNSNTTIIWTSLFEWYVHGCGSKVGHHRYMCLEEIGLHASFMLRFNG